jgi:hypothetical protein
MSMNEAPDTSMMQLAEINRLVYLRPSNSALISQRTFKTYNAANLVAQLGSTIQAIMNSGSDYVYGPTSYMRVEFTAGGNVKWGFNGSIMNIFRNLRITHSSGESLENILNIDVLSAIKLFYENRNDDWQKLYPLLAFKDKNDNASIPNGTYVACIPLSLLSGIFARSDQYIPSSLMSGLKIELDLNSGANCLFDGTITDIKPTFVLDSCVLYDAIQKQLMAQQSDIAQSGLQFTYSSVFNSANEYVAGTAVGVNLDVQQSASLTEKVVAVFRRNVDRKNKQFYVFAPVVTNLQYRLGALYLPQQPLRLGAAGAATTSAAQKQQEEAYSTTLIAYDDWTHQYASTFVRGVNVTPFDFRGGLVTDDTKLEYADPQPCAAYAVTLERSASGLSLSGESTNNSRLLNLSATLCVPDGSASAATYPGGAQVQLYLSYTKVANVMGSNLVLDR